MRLEFLAERWKTLFYLLCVRNYAKTLTTLPTDLQILSHWATGAPIVIHSVAKTAFTSGPFDTALRLGGKWWSSKDVTLLWVRRRGPRSAPVSCANYLSLCSPPHFFLLCRHQDGTQPSALHLLFKLTDRAWSSSQERFQDSPIWLMLGLYLNQNLKEMEILRIHFLICNILETQMYNFLYP